MKIKIGPTGRLVTGSVLDVSKRGLEQALRAYDELLYIKWNPKKRSGMGCWEIRRRPDKKTALYEGEYEGTHLYRVEWDELDIVHHVLDVDTLNYGVLTKIMKMDVWKYKNLVAEIDYAEKKYAEKIEKQTQEEMAYLIKQHKREIREFREMILSGHNPARILASNWGR
jgi:hypothetical protein